MSTELSLGIQMYSIAKLLHQSIFLNGTLTNVETWPNCSTSRIEAFERVEQSFLRKILQAHSKTHIEALYLEIGVIPLRYHLMTRRIMYLQSILLRDDDEITKKVVLLQKARGHNGDFYSQTKTDMEHLSIFEADLSQSKNKLKETLKKQMKRKAFEYLINKAKKHSKVKAELYNNCDGCSHYSDARFTTHETNILFKFRTRTFLVKNNFRNNYTNTNTLCPLCHNEEDTQQHLFSCTAILHKYGKQCMNKYEDIFSDNNDTLLQTAKELYELVAIRNLLLHPDDD